MPAEWFYKVGNKAIGPVTPSVLRQLVSAGAVTKSTLVRKGQGDRWVTAGQVRGLFAERKPVSKPSKRMERQRGTGDANSATDDQIQEWLKTSNASDRPGTSQAQDESGTESTPLKPLHARTSESTSESPMNVDVLVPLLNAMIRPIRDSAVEQIQLALREIEDEELQARFKLLLMHVCLASVLYRLDHRRGSPAGLSSQFRNLAISQFSRPRDLTLASYHKIFAYIQQQLGDKLVSPDENQLVDVGVTLLSAAVPAQEEFTSVSALACGKAAHACWRHAALEANRVLGDAVEIDVTTAKIDEQVYLMNYERHYADILANHLTRTRLAELFLFRAWTAQFGYRVFSTDQYASEKLIGETVNSCKYLGLGIFQVTHGFSIESVLGGEFFDLIEDRWHQYDVVVSALLGSSGIPTVEIITVLTNRLNIIDPTVTVKLSTDFLSQLDFIKRTAIETGVLNPGDAR